MYEEKWSGSNTRTGQVGHVGDKKHSVGRVPDGEMSTLTTEQYDLHNPDMMASHAAWFTGRHVVLSVSLGPIVKCWRHGTPWLLPSTFCGSSKFEYFINPIPNDH